MKIGELAARAGLNASAIRYYETEGLLPTPHRLNGHRRYSPEALDRVLLIRFAGEMGFSLAEIRLFLHGLRENAPPSARWKEFATQKLIEVEQSIARTLKLRTLLRNLLHCRCASLNECVRRLGLSENLRAVANRPNQKAAHRSS